MNSQTGSIPGLSVFGLSARQMAIAFAILLVCAIALTAFFQIWNAGESSDSGHARTAAAKGTGVYISNEPAWRRKQRFQRMLGSDADSHGDANRYLVRSGFLVGRAPAHADRMAARNIEELRTALSHTELDIYEVYMGSAAQLGMTDPPLLTAPLNFGSARFTHIAAEANLYTFFDDIKRFAILSYAASILPLGLPIPEVGARFASGFGPREDPISGESKMHGGTDFAAPEGAPVLATAKGEVVFAGERGGYGNTIQIRHEFGLETTYAHLKQIRVEAGDLVEFNMWIGDMGSTGRSTGSHLHYEITIDGERVDPMKFIRAGRHVYFN